MFRVFLRGIQQEKRLLQDIQWTWVENILANYLKSNTFQINFKNILIKQNYLMDCIKLMKQMSTKKEDVTIRLFPRPSRFQVAFNEQSLINDPEAAHRRQSKQTSSTGSDIYNDDQIVMMSQLYEIFRQPNQQGRQYFNRLPILQFQRLQFLQIFQNFKLIQKMQQTDLSPQIQILSERKRQKNIGNFDFGNRFSYRPRSDLYRYQYKNQFKYNFQFE